MFQKWPQKTAGSLPVHRFILDREIRIAVLLAQEIMELQILFLSAWELQDSALLIRKRRCAILEECARFKVILQAVT